MNWSRCKIGHFFSFFTRFCFVLLSGEISLKLVYHCWPFCNINPQPPTGNVNKSCQGWHGTSITLNHFAPKWEHLWKGLACCNLCAVTSHLELFCLNFPVCPRQISRHGKSLGCSGSVTSWNGSTDLDIWNWSCTDSLILVQELPWMDLHHSQQHCSWVDFSAICH